MSTRANIIYNMIDTPVVPQENRPFYNEDTKFYYQHTDGYPSGLGEDLKDIVNYQTTVSPVKTLPERLDYYYEEVESVHGDINYLYVITETPREIIIQCYCYDCMDKRPDYDMLVFETEPKFISTYFKPNYTV